MGSHEMIEKSPVKVIAVASGKGGVGKTNVSVNLAVGLAKSGQKVMLMDADLGMANVDIMLGIKPKFTLLDVITGERTLDEVIVEGPLGISIIPASSGVGKMADLSIMEQGGLIRAFGELDNKVDVLIIDTAAGVSSSVVSFSKASQEIFVVLCDEPASLTDAYGLIKVLYQEHGVKKFQILANMVKDSKHGRQLYAKLSRAAESYLADVSLGYMGSIPMDTKLRDAVRVQAAVMEKFPHCSSSIAFQNLAQKVIDLPVMSSSTGYLEFFIERITENGNTVRSMY